MRKGTELALKAGSLQHKIAERVISIFINIFCSLRINKLPSMNKASQKVFTSLWKRANLQSFLDFSPIRRFIDLSQIRYPLGETSKTSISIVIPCHPKDHALLSVVLEGLKRNCLNPITEIVIVSPEPLQFEHFPETNIRFVNDSQIVDSKLLEIINTNFPQSQFGWIFQQVLKIQTAMNFTRNDQILVIDSDTVISKRTLFIDGNRQILNITREYHRQYIKQYQNFTKSNFDIGLSFVTHHQLWQRDILEELWGGDRLYEWLSCADTSSTSSMSEYHSYGSYIIQNHPKRFEFSQWANAELSRTDMNDLSYEAVACAARDARSISIHSYS